VTANHRHSLHRVLAVIEVFDIGRVFVRPIAIRLREIAKDSNDCEVVGEEITARDFEKIMRGAVTCVALEQLYLVIHRLAIDATCISAVRREDVTRHEEEPRVDLVEDFVVSRGVVFSVVIHGSVVITQSIVQDIGRK